jgi:hypothetical protein
MDYGYLTKVYNHLNLTAHGSVKLYLKLKGKNIMKNTIEKFLKVKKEKLEILESSYQVYYAANRHGVAGNEWFSNMEKFMAQFLLDAMNNEVHGSMHDRDLCQGGQWESYIDFHLDVIDQCFDAIEAASPNPDIQDQVREKLHDYMKTFMGENLYNHMRYVLDECLEEHYDLDDGNAFTITRQMIEFAFYSYNLDLDYIY